MFYNKIFLSLILFLSPVFCFAQYSEQIFEAEVLEISEQRELVREDGSKNIQQNVKLRGLSGDWVGRIFYFYGVSDLDVINSNVYEPGDKVSVRYTRDTDGNDIFYITDYVRRTGLYLMAAIFSLLVILIGRWKGLRALVSLAISFVVIMKFIVPHILAGYDPLIISIFGSFLILLFIIYITEGFNKKSHVAILSITICLFITALLSVLFTSLTKLSGLGDEEVMHLVSFGHGAINFKGLLLAAILIGALGVLDDVVISQIESVGQIREANASLSKKRVFSLAYKIGNTHLGAVVNTLFLAYAGASLPLLLLFSIKQPPFLNFSQVINSEIIATEITRALVGSMGIALAMPIATFLAVYFYKK